MFWVLFACLSLGNRIVSLRRFEAFFRCKFDASSAEGFVNGCARRKETGLAVFCGAVSVLAITAAWWRVSHAAILYDEAHTYIYYAHPEIIQASIPSAQYLNNHLLNTFLVRIVDLFPCVAFSEIAIRLPSLMSQMLFLWFAFLIFRKRRGVACAVFAALALNP